MQTNFHSFLTYLTNTLNPMSLEDNKLVKRALVLFRQGQVQNVTFDDPYLFGHVTEIKEFYITLNIIDPHKSNCSCDGKELCVHKLALFFNYFGQFSSVILWVDEWKNKQAATDPTQYAEPLEQEYGTWASFIKDKLAIFLPSDALINKYNFQRLQTNFEDAIKVHEPIEYEWAMLYKSIAYFLALKHIWNFSERDIISQLNQQFLSRFKTAINQYSQSPIFFQADKFHLSLLSNTRNEIFFNPVFSSTKWQVYRLLWSSRLSTVKQRADEIQILKENQENAFCIWAKVHLYLTNKDDLAALNTLKSVNFKQLENISILFEEFNSKKEFNRVLPIADWIIKERTDFLKNLCLNELSIRIFSKQIRIAAQELNRVDILEKFYKECLPSTSKDYLAFLYSQKNYSKWIDLLFISHQENLMLYYEEIKNIENTQPELTLPFYHREIYLLILQKDRTSYRQASRLLNHLREIYKNCNRLSEWNLFLNHLIENNRRLRAFQDELKRWNLHVSSNE